MPPLVEDDASKVARLTRPQVGAYSGDDGTVCVTLPQPHSLILFQGLYPFHSIYS